MRSIRRRLRRRFEVHPAPFEQGKGLLEASPVRALVGFEAEVPFADHAGAITASAQQLGNRMGLLVEITLVPRFAALERLDSLLHGAQASQVIVGTGHRHRPGQRAGRRGVHVGQLQAIGSQLVQVGRGDFTAKGAQVGITEVIGQDQ